MRWATFRLLIITSWTWLNFIWQWLKSSGSIHQIILQTCNHDMYAFTVKASYLHCRVNVFDLQSHRGSGLWPEGNCSCWASGLLPSWLPSGDTEQENRWNNKWKVDMLRYYLWTYNSFSKTTLDEKGDMLFSSLLWSWALKKSSVGECHLFDSNWKLHFVHCHRSLKQSRLASLVFSLKHRSSVGSHRTFLKRFHW